LQLDVKRMAADIGVLAADDFHGRYTLSADLQRAAEFLARRYGELGLQPLASGFLVDFPLRTGARLGEPARLELVRGGRPTAIPEAEFVVLPQSASGSVQGELVFVGYAAASEAEEGEEKKEEKSGELPKGDGAATHAPAYDDLAGVDVKGKVALVLLEAPGRPDPMALFKRLQDEATRFTEAAAPMKAAKDAAGLTKLHAEARGRLLELVDPYVPKAGLGERVAAARGRADRRVRPAEDRGRADARGGEAAGAALRVRGGGLKTKVERLAKAGAVGVIAVRGPRSFVTPEEREADELPDASSRAAPACSASRWRCRSCR
jgi:hypothetical protein